MIRAKQILCTAVVLAVGAGMVAQAADEEGYFLPLKQKGQLIWRGRVEDSAGTWYDIRIVPGYTPPARYGWRNLKQAGHNMGEYFEKKKYSRLWESSTDCLEWAFDDCLADFAIEGSGRAWKKYFRRAQQRTEKRVFGWWLSYPWAVMQSTVDNVVRIPVGLVGTAVGTVSGAAVVPAYHLVNSSVKAVWNGGVEGVALPVVGVAWNTVVAPPLSLLGQQPSQERVDGFWVRMVDGAAPPAEPDGEAVAAIAEWGRLLNSELKPFEEQRQRVDEERDRELKALNEKRNQLYRLAQAELARISGEEATEARKLCADPAQATLLKSAQDAGWSRARIAQHREAIVKRLMKAGLSLSDAERAMQHLLNHPPYPANAAISTGEIQKTDPVRASIDVIKAID